MLTFSLDSGNDEAQRYAYQALSAAAASTETSLPLQSHLAVLQGGGNGHCLLSRDSPVSLRP